MADFNLTRRISFALRSTFLVVLLVPWTPTVLAELTPKFDPKLRSAMEQTQLVAKSPSAALPTIPAFEWTVEQSRPLKKPRILKESYQPVSPALGLHGLAVSSVTDLTPGRENPKSTQTTTPSAASYTIRGLERVREDDTSLSFSTQQLKMPLQAGQRFELNIEFEKHESLKLVSPELPDQRRRLRPVFLDKR